MIALTKYIQPIAAESSLFAVWINFRELQDKRQKVIHGISGLKRITKYLQEFQDMRNCNGQGHSKGKEPQYDKR
jgi:hypothetical protein